MGRRLRALLALGAVLVVGTAPTWASWSDSRPVPDETFTLGSLDLTVNGADPFTGFTAMNFATMVPGDSVAGVLTVRNAGTIPLSYYAEAAATSALGTALVVRVTDAATVTGSNPSATCGGTLVPQSATSFPATTGPFVASNAARRTLAPGASETLCIQASLPTGAPATLNGLTTVVSFTFHGKQVGAP